jgi:small-conductance mechanosensitive channel
MTARLRIFAALFLCFLTPIALAQDAATGSGGSTVSAGQANEALIRLLEDPKGRAALIEQLRRAQENEAGEAGTSSAGADSGTAPSGTSETGEATAATDNAPSTVPAEATDPSTPQTQPFAVRLGEYTKVVADDFGLIIERMGHALKGVRLLLDGSLQVKWDQFYAAILEVVLVLFSATVVYLIGQRLIGLAHRRLDLKARYGGWGMRAAILGLTTILDAGTVLVGWGAGYVVALSSFGGLESGVSLLESLTLNAFMVTGVAKVALRFVFAPARPYLRLLPFEDKASIYWTRWLGFVLGWLSYGIMLAVPVANLAVSFVIGNGVRFIVVLIGALIMLVLVLRNRKRVAAAVREYAEQLSSEIAKRMMFLVARIWHFAAFFYIFMMFMVWLFRPFDAMAIIFRSTGLSILTIMGGVLLSLMMSRAITRGIRLPDRMRQSLPALQDRLNAFVPRILKIFRFVVFITTVLILLDIWHIVSFLDWLRSEDGIGIISRYGSAVFVLLAAFAIWLAIMSWVDLRLRDRTGYMVSARERTLFQLFRNAVTVVIMVMGVLLALSEVGINIGPLIAGAGVVGLAISFGAQTLVKDIITGAFIQIENAMNEGDVVTVAGITGTVEHLTVRSVRLRDLEGTTHVVPFSSVDMVSNFMRGFSYHVALIGVAYDTDIKLARAALEEAFRRLAELPEFRPKIIGDLEIHGITNFGASSIDIRARIKTTPGDQWGVGRAFNAFVKEVFDEEGIEIPFPQVTYHAATPPPMADTESKLLKAETKKKTGRSKKADSTHGTGVDHGGAEE